MLPLLIPIALEVAKLAAPKLVRALTNSDEAGAVAERVVGIAQQVTGSTSPEEALSKLQADPNLVLQANIRMQEIEADLEKAFLADIANARTRDLELRKAGSENRRANWMVALDVAGLIACIAAITFYKQSIPGEAVGILATVAGVFGACLRDAHQFEFGSSRGSREKDAALVRQLES